MRTCKGCPYRDGVLSAFTYQNLFGSFEQLGFIKTQKDVWETKRSTHGWVKVRTSYEEWQIDVVFETSEEYQEFILTLESHGIHTLTYTPNTILRYLGLANEFVIRK